jgi:predicted ATPase
MPANKIKKLTLNNFKSLVDTEIDLSKNTFLIGLNGSGKTTILQAIDFLSAIAGGDVESWLESRGWRKQELTYFGSSKKLIEFKIDFEISGIDYRWEFTFNRDLLRNTSEKLYKEKDLLAEVFEGHYRISRQAKIKIGFNYNGSIVSVLKDEVLGKEIINIRRFFKHIKSAELLSPILMKKKARHAEGDIGLGGEKLSAFIDELPSAKKERLLEELKRFFPKVETIKTKSLKGGWKELSLNESFDGKRLSIESRHLSDGILRIIAILAQLQNSESVLLFDEIEDGVNQELVNLLVDVIISSPHQTVVATHSPLLLNYLDDKVAEKSVLFVYRTPTGETKTINFYKVIKDKLSDAELQIMGPGEWMQSIDLLSLTEALQNMGE